MKSLPASLILWQALIKRRASLIDYHFRSLLRRDNDIVKPLQLALQKTDKMNERSDTIMRDIVSIIRSVIGNFSYQFVDYNAIRNTILHYSYLSSIPNDILTTLLISSRIPCQLLAARTRATVSGNGGKEEADIRRLLGFSCLRVNIRFTLYFTAAVARNYDRPKF